MTWVMGTFRSPVLPEDSPPSPPCPAWVDPFPGRERPVRQAAEPPHEASGGVAWTRHLACACLAKNRPRGRTSPLSNRHRCGVTAPHPSPLLRKQRGAKPIASASACKLERLQAEAQVSNRMSPPLAFRRFEEG